MTIPHVADFAKVGFFAFAFIWLANRLLRKTGLAQYTTKGV